MGSPYGGGSFSSPYGPNTLPPGLNPSTSVVYAEGAQELLDSQQQNLAAATDLYSQSIATPMDELYQQNVFPEFQQNAALSEASFAGLTNQAYDWTKNLIKPTAGSVVGGGVNAGATTAGGYLPDLTTSYPNWSAPDTNFLMGSESAGSGFGALPGSGAEYGVTTANPTQPFSVSGNNLMGEITITEPALTSGTGATPNALSSTTTTTGGAGGGSAAGAGIYPAHYPATNILGGTAMRTPAQLGLTGGLGFGASLLGAGIQRWADDNDPTTLTAGELAGQGIKSAGTGASLAALAGSLAPALAIPGIGWIGAGIGALVGLLGARRRRKKARKARNEYRQKIRKKQRKALIGARKSESELVQGNLMSRTYGGYDYGNQLVQYKMGGALGYYGEGGNLAGLAKTLLPQKSQNNTNDLANLVLGKQGKLPYSGPIEGGSLKRGGTVPQYQNQGFFEGEWDYLNRSQTVGSGPRDTTKLKVNTGIPGLEHLDITGGKSLEEIKDLLNNKGINLDSLKNPLSKGIPNLEDIQKLMQLDKLLKKPNFKDDVAIWERKEGGALKYQDEGALQPDTLWNQNFTSFMNDRPEYHYLTTDQTGRHIEGIGTNYDQSGTLVNRPVNNFRAPFFPGNVGIQAPGGLSTNWGTDLRNQVSQSNASYYANQLFNSKNE